MTMTDPRSLAGNTASRLTSVAALPDYRAEFAEARADDPSIIGLRGHVHRDRDGESDHPWNFTVDYVSADNPRGDYTADPFEYGSVATQPEALTAACGVLAQVGVRVTHPGELA